MGRGGERQGGSGGGEQGAVFGQIMCTYGQKTSMYAKQN